MFDTYLPGCILVSIAFFILGWICGSAKERHIWNHHINCSYLKWITRGDDDG